MARVKFECENAKLVAEEALWLAWQACGGPVGKGVLQDNAGATKQDVVKNALTAGDYPAMHRVKKPGEINADYVFGRMMKLWCEVVKDGILYSDRKITPNYESWCLVYPTYEDLFEAAVKSR